jgi:hypothetical protein
MKSIFENQDFATFLEGFMPSMTNNSNHEVKINTATYCPLQMQINNKLTKFLILD